MSIDMSSSSVRGASDPSYGPSHGFISAQCLLKNVPNFFSSNLELALVTKQPPQHGNKKLNFKRAGSKSIFFSV
jgi:hypothetical protein